MRLQRDPANYQSLCAEHHGLKTRGKRFSKETGADGMPIDPAHTFYLQR
jgi:hypothetical protein